ncbi:MAG: hypothetical protein QG573_1999 [Acidobacteriota bacterium]|nr:hypothetical protein [Acidobacteriota bacterium]
MAAVAGEVSPPAASFQEEIAERVNAERAACRSAGCPLAPLKLLPQLSAVADAHSRAMAYDDFFSHCNIATGRGTWERLRHAGYGYSSAGENLASGGSTPAAAMAQWMRSPEHRANILSADYRELGVGYYRQDDDLANVDRDGNGDCDCRDRGETCRGEALTHYWTQLFGRRDDFHPLVIAGERHATAGAAVEVYLYGPPGAARMRLRNDGGSWSVWQPFAPRVSWTLAAGDGRRTVFSEVVAAGAIHRACDRIWLTGAGPPEKSDEPVACEDDGTFRAGEP